MRERVFSALAFRAPDRIPLEYHPSPAGVHEHGERLQSLALAFPDDFNAGPPFPPAGPDPRWIDREGQYHEFRRDEWGVLWEHLIYGVAGHPVERPLDEWANLRTFQAPRIPEPKGEDFVREQRRARRHCETAFLKSGWISIFETMHALRRFEDVLMDLASDRAEIHSLADLITEYRLAEIESLLARGVDAIQFGDDYGTQRTMMLAPAIFRKFFVPRYQRLMKPILDAGKKVFFHTCGCNQRILDDIAALGVHAIWPQLSSYDLHWLAGWARLARVAVALHPDRGELMTRGTPDQVRANVAELAEVFRADSGGAWFYVEIDAGFPFANVQALIECIGRMRA